MTENISPFRTELGAYLKKENFNIFISKKFTV